MGSRIIGSVGQKDQINPIWQNPN